MSEQKVELVSVIIPLYNARPYIEQTINSILQQTMSDLHLYIVDDHSTDGSAEVAKHYAVEQPDRVSYFRPEKAGGRPSVGKNIGIKMSRGHYIAFMDHDDWWQPNHLEALTARFHSQPELAMTGSNGYFFDNDRNQVVGVYRPVAENLANPEARALTLKMPTYLTSSCMLIDRRVFTETGPLDETLKMSDDHELTIRLVAKNYPLETRGEPTIYRRWLTSSLSNSDEAIARAINDIETIHRRYRQSPNLSSVEGRLFDGWYYLVYKRLGNYYLADGQAALAMTEYEKVVAAGFGDRTLKLFIWLAKVSPWLASLVARTKRRWSFRHPPAFAATNQ